MFAVQDSTGLVAGANAYVDAGAFRIYFEDAGIDTSAWDDAKVQGAIVQGTRLIGTAFNYLGSKLAGDLQTTAFPRYKDSIPDPPLVDIPQEIKDANCEYAMFVLSGKALMLSLEANETGVIEQYDAVDTIKTRTKYVGGNIGNNGMAFVPFAELLLAKSGWLYTCKNVIIRS